MATTSTKTASLNLAQLKWLAQHVGLSAQNAAIAAAIAFSAESGGNPAATNYNTNGTFDRGLWQINTVHVSGNPQVFNNDEVYTPLGNALAMANLSAGGTNWGAWSGDVATVTQNGTLAAAQAVTPESIPATQLITQYNPGSTNDVQAGVSGDPIGKAAGSLPADWHDLLQTLGGAGSYSGQFTTQPGQPAPDSGGASAGVFGPATSFWSALGSDLKWLGIIVGQLAGGILLLWIALKTLVALPSGNKVGIPELTWFLLGAAATLIWSALRAQNSVCVIQNAVSGKSADCSIHATALPNLGATTLKSFVNLLIP